MEFLLLIYRPNQDHQFTDEYWMKFQKDSKLYYDNLKKKGILISVNPIQEGSILISHTNAAFKETVNQESRKKSLFYHIKMNNLKQAIDVAKQNPEYVFFKDVRIEVLPINLEE